MHKILLICLLCLNLSLSTIPTVMAESPQNSLEKQMELIQNDIKVDDLDIEPINTKDLKKKVVPDAKQEGKKVLFLFLKTMLGVIVASGIIYVVLIFVRKYRSSAFVELEYDEYASLDLTTPTNKQEAFMSFLNRTSI